jgi:hypothetical protein
MRHLAFGSRLRGRSQSQPPSGGFFVYSLSRVGRLRRAQPGRHFFRKRMSAITGAVSDVLEVVGLRRHAGTLHDAG